MFSVSGKFYEFNITTNFKNNISVGNNNLGQITLIKNFGVINTTYINNDNITDMYINLNDIVVNNDSQIFQIAGISKNIGESFNVFTASNEYVAMGLSNNRTILIHVAALQNPLVNISFMNLVFDYTIPTEFVLDIDKILEFNLTIPLNAPPSTQSPIMIIKSNNLTKQNIQLEFNINALKLWTLKNYAFTDKVNAGETGIAGNMTFINDGNTMSTVNMSLSGNISSILSTMTNTLIFPNTNTNLQLVYSLGNNIAVGKYSGFLWISGEGKEQNLSLNIDVKDNILPEIIEITIPEFMAGLPRTVNIKVHDNLGIKGVTLQKKFNGAVEDTLDFYKSQETDWWHTDVILLNPGDYKFLINVTDIGGNTFSKEYIIPSMQINTVSYKTYYKMFTTKYDKWSIISDFFTMNESIPLTVSLFSMMYNGNFSMALILPNGELRYWDKNPDLTYKPIVVNLPGTYGIQFKGDAKNDYNGVVKFSTTTNHVPFHDVIVVGTIGDFIIPPPYSTDWYNGKLNCQVQDGGNPESSTTICTLAFPGYVNIKENALPVTTELKISKETEYNDNLEKLNKMIWNKNAIIALMIFIMIGLSIFAWYLFKVYPILRLKLR